MEHVKVTLRRHPVAGWVILIIIVFSGFITVLSQFLNVLKSLGWIN